MFILDQDSISIEEKEETKTDFSAPTLSFLINNFVLAS
jgi:hypothetical protein